MIIENNNTNNGIGFFGALQIAFIILKLCKIINWSWPIVLLPIIIGIGTIVLFILFCLIYVFIITRRK